jgi:MFS transporter, SP family, general alpha glucoside:H+ symporter
LNAPILESEDPQGLQHLANLFRPLDETFFAVWNNSSQECSKDWLLRRENDIRCALPPYLNVSDEEMANLRVSQSWLRIKLWELFPRFGFLSTESVYECLTFRYPILVARDLLLVTNQLLISSLKVHGVGLVSGTFQSYRILILIYTRQKRSSMLHALLRMFFHSFHLSLHTMGLILLDI